MKKVETRTLFHNFQTLLDGLEPKKCKDKV